MGNPKRWTAIAILVACSAVMQVTIIYRSSVPALDSLRSVAAAEAFLQSPSLATLAEEPESPLFPVWLAAVHRTREALFSSPPRWDASVQLAAAIPIVLWPVPIYWLTRRRYGGRTARIAGLLACLLPTAVQLGGEGLPDALYLLILATAFALLSRERLTTWPSIAAGIAVGLATLVRVEAVLLLAVATFALRWPIPRSWRFAITPSIGAAIVIVTWLWASDSLAPRDAITRLASSSPARDGWVFNAASVDAEASNSSSIVDSGYAFDSKERGQSTRRYGLIAALVETADELLIATGFVLIPLTIAGNWNARRWRLCDRMALIGALAWPLLGFANALATGYLSSRHLLPAAVFLLPAAARGLNTLHRVSAMRPTLRFGLAPAVIIVWSVWCWRPLHADRDGHRVAGDWLAAQAAPDDFVLDTWGWSALTSGRATYRYDAARDAFSDARLRFVVVEQRELESGSPRAMTLCDLLARHGARAVEFAPSEGQSPVLIFHWRPPLAQNEVAANNKLGCLGSKLKNIPHIEKTTGELVK
jgi:4-amino-4-deoxy-L-arabinose transferase-like glycosyltransferase